MMCAALRSVRSFVHLFLIDVLHQFFFATIAAKYIL